MSSPAPIALFVYNRPDHARETLKGLRRCDQSTQTPVYVFSDGPKNEAGIEKVKAVRQMLAEVGKDHGFASFTVIEAPENRGLAKSIISGVSEVMAKHGRAIVMEDDLVTSLDCLKFLNDCLDFYDADKSIGQISAFSLPIKAPSDYQHSVYKLRRTCSTGWATWSDRWEKVDWNASQFDSFMQDRAAQKRFGEAGTDRLSRLVRQVKADAKSWSVLFGFSQFMQGLCSIYPVQGRINNIGTDGTGVHLASDHINGNFYPEGAPYQLSNPDFDERIVSQVRRLYSPTFAARLSALKRKLFGA